jgi:hypothetical protein
MTKEPLITGYSTINFREYVMSINRLYFAALVATATLSGCASMPQNSVLDEARSDYQAAQANPKVVELAPYELKQAGDALSKATDAASKQEDAATVSHLAYLAKQRTAIAQETARQKLAEATVANAAEERGDIRLAARTAEVDKALQSAETARQQAALSRMQSEISQEQARDAELRTSQLEAELKELNAKQTERGLVITLGDVLFDTNQAQLKTGGIAAWKSSPAFSSSTQGAMCGSKGTPTAPEVPTIISCSPSVVPMPCARPCWIWVSTATASVPVAMARSPRSPATIPPWVGS